MTTVLNVPPSLDDKTFETVLDQLAPVPQDEKVLLDARHTRWASPYGLTALLTLAQTRAERPALYVPESEDTSSYWARTAFFTFADDLFELHGSVPRTRPAGESDVLPPPGTPVELDGIRFVVLSDDEDTSRVVVEGLGRTGRVLASTPLEDPTFGKATP